MKERERKKNEREKLMLGEATDSELVSKEE